ncbi:MAG: hypothetical protein ACXQS4_03480, partial [Methermicoccaceae archaeon]
RILHRIINRFEKFGAKQDLEWIKNVENTIDDQLIKIKEKNNVYNIRVANSFMLMSWFRRRYFGNIKQHIDNVMYQILNADDILSSLERLTQHEDDLILRPLFIIPDSTKKIRDIVIQSYIQNHRECLKNLKERFK